MASDSALSDARALLLDLEEILDKAPTEWMAIMLRNAARGADDDSEAFLVSNDLWGGSGSVADQSQGIERKLVQLGRLQMLRGKVNPRTERIVTTLEHRIKQGIV